MAATTDQVVSYLVRHNYLLTALELFLEACEAGREAEVEVLHQLFRDPAHFPPEEVARFNPQHALAVQGAARQREERLSLLEYELRVAREDLRELRAAQLAQHEPSEQQQQPQGPGPPPGPWSSPARQGAPGTESVAEYRGVPPAAPEASPPPAPAAINMEGLSPAERRELLMGVRAFLADHGLRLTAMTLAEECGASGQAAAPAAAPAPVVSLAHCLRAQQAQPALEEQLAEAKGEAANLRHRLAEAQRQLEHERSALGVARAELEFTQAKLSYLLVQGHSAGQPHQAQQQGAAKAGGAPVVPADEAAQQGTQHGLGVAIDEPAQTQGAGQFEARTAALAVPAGVLVQSCGSSGLMGGPSQRQADDAGLPSEPGAELQFRVLGPRGALEEVAAALPAIVPHVLINKRDELVPVLLAICQEHPSPLTRQRTAALLLNLVRKPNAAQRGMIAAACARLAHCIGPGRTALELLPHIADQATHEYVERRILMGEVAARLGPLLAPEDCAGALLEAVQALAGDPVPQVRAVATVALGALVAALPNLQASYTQVQALLLRLTGDPSRDVVEALLRHVLPALLQGLGSSAILTTQLLPKVLAELQAVLQRCPFLAGTDEAALANGNALLRALPAVAQNQATALLQIYVAALPALRSHALAALPDWAVAWADGCLGRQQLGQQAVLRSLPATGGEAAPEATPGGPSQLLSLPTAGPVAGSAGLDGTPATEPGLAAGAEPFPLSDCRSSRLSDQNLASGGSQQQLLLSQLMGWQRGSPTSLASASSSSLRNSQLSWASQASSHHDNDASIPGNNLMMVASGSSAGSKMAAGGEGAQPRPALPCRSGRSARSGSSNRHRPNPFASPGFAVGAVEGLRKALAAAPEAQLAGAARAPEGAGTQEPESGAPPVWAEVAPEANAGTPFVHSTAAAVVGRQPSEQGSAQVAVPSGTAGPLAIQQCRRASDVDLHGSVYGGRVGTAGSPGGGDGSSTATAQGAACTGHRRDVLWEEAALGAWAASEQHAEWHAVDYLAAAALPQLIQATIMVPPTRDTLQLRRKFATALRATCLALGPNLTRQVVEPALLAVSSAPDWRPPAERQSRRASALAQQMAPKTPEAEQAGRATGLPLLLAGVLSIESAVADAANCLRHLVLGLPGGSAAGSAAGASWALAHPQAFGEAVRFAAGSSHMQASLLEVMWEAAVSQSTGARVASALLAGALAAVLPPQQASKQLLPAVVALAGDGEPQVCAAGMAAAAEVLRAFPAEQQLQEALLGELGVVAERCGHSAEVSLLRALVSVASGSGASEGLVLWVLQRVQLTLATMHQRAACGRSPSQLAEMASTLFHLLRALEAHEFTSAQACLHFTAALQALQREGDLLQPPQRDAVAAMAADHAQLFTSEDLARRHTSSVGDKAEAAILQTPSLNSFLPGARRAALPAGSMLAALAHRMGSQDDSHAPVTAPGGIQAMAVEGRGVSGAIGLGIESTAQTLQARVGEGGFWQAFAGWQYGAP